MKKTYAKVSIENILDFSDCETLISLVTSTPSIISVTEVFLVFIYIGKERTAIIENIKQIRGIINPNHLFFFLERKICKQTVPARNISITTKAIAVLGIYFPSF